DISKDFIFHFLNVPVAQVVVRITLGLVYIYSAKTLIDPPRVGKKADIIIMVAGYVIYGAFFLVWMFLKSMSYSLSTLTLFNDCFYVTLFYFLVHFFFRLHLEHENAFFIWAICGILIHPQYIVDLIFKMVEAKYSGLFSADFSFFQNILF